MVITEGLAMVEDIIIESMLLMLGDIIIHIFESRIINFTFIPYIIVGKYTVFS